MVSQMEFQVIKTALSFVIYSCFRYFDIRSTKAVSEVLSLERYEVNPLIVYLSKKFGAETAFRIHYWVLAIPIALIDGFIYNADTSFPTLALFFGFFHVLASINNTSIYFKVKEFGSASVEANLQHIKYRMSNMNLLEKISYIAGINFEYIGLSIWSMFIFIFFLRNLGALDFKPVSNQVAVNFLYGLLMLFALLIYYPFSVFGNLLVYIRNNKQTELTEIIVKDNSVTISVDILERSIKEANENNMKYVKFQLK